MNTMANPESIIPAEPAAAPMTELDSRKANGACIAKDTIIKGEISKCKHIEIYGQLEGQADVGHVIIHREGEVKGSLTAASAVIHGIIDGDISITGLLEITGSGSVTGKVEYGQISVENGAILSADLRKKKKTA